MSKITFRADDDLVRRLEEFDASKSEVMREALREYLDGRSTESTGTDPGVDEGSLDQLVAERVDAIISDRFDAMFTPRQPQDVNVNVTLDGDTRPVSDAKSREVNTKTGSSHAVSNESSHERESRMTDDADENTAANEAANDRKTCSQCGETLSPSHVYCPNCGEKSAHRVFCECGDELRSDWGFCPGCGRRTPAADVLDNPERP
jgi:predicted transcriptional regulator/post-segregation antitoxin (ccd killing protein)